MNKVQKPPGIARRRLRPYPQYKDSGVEWLGKIPADWEVRRLKRSFRVINGSTPASGESTYWDGDIPWVTPEDLGDLTGVTIYTTRRRITETGYCSCGTTVVPADSLILSTRAPIGHLAIAGVDLCTNQGCKSLVFRRSLPRKYWFYLILVARKELESLGQGSTFRELASSKLEALPIAEPQTAEQRAIATFLDRETKKINALIEKKERLIELLQEKRTALITQAVTKGLDPTVPMKDSGIEWLGKIPEHWAISPLFTVAHEQDVRNIGGAEENVLSLSYGHIVRRDVSDNFGLMPESFNTYQIVEPGNIVLRLTDLQNDKRSLRVGLVRERGIITSAYTTLRVSGGLEYEYAAYLLYAYDVTKVFYGLGGGVRQTMKFEDLKWMPLLIPPNNEQRAIATFLDRETARIDALITKVREAIASLKEYRTALISAAVTGKIDVREAS